MMCTRRGSLAAGVALMAALVAASCCRKGDTASIDTPVESVSLQDVQALFGGRNVWVSSNGKVIAQVVEPGLKETRYEHRLAPGQFAALESLLAEHEFARIQFKERSGVPDEARPTITVATADGRATVVAKWANDAHPGFDAVYKKLLAIADDAKQTNKPVHEGKFDAAWRPDGWK